ncbi:MAG: hypothetical protein ABR575_10935 [Actinomycetota bacterium]
MGARRVVVTERFHISFICTGNRARSPVAEYTMRAATEGLPITVSSAGLLDLDGARPLPDVATAASDLGLDLSAHASACIHGADLSSADLVIGFELQHVAGAVIEARAPRRVTFTLPELLRLLDGAHGSETDPVARARSLVGQADDRREREQRPLVEEIRDPIGEPRDVQSRIAQQVHVMTLRLAEQLFGRAPDTSGVTGSSNPA